MKHKARNGPEAALPPPRKDSMGDGEIARVNDEKWTDHHAAGRPRQLPESSPFVSIVRVAESLLMPPAGQMKNYGFATVDNERRTLLSGLVEKV